MATRKSTFLSEKERNAFFEQAEKSPNTLLGISPTGRNTGAVLAGFKKLKVPDRPDTAFEQILQLQLKHVITMNVHIPLTHEVESEYLKLFEYWNTTHQILAEVSFTGLQIRYYHFFDTKNGKIKNGLTATATGFTLIS